MPEIFRITHESGTLSEYDNIDNIDGDDIAVTSAAALSGNFGLQIRIDDTANLWVRKNFSIPTSKFMRLGCKLDVNSLAMAGSDSFRVFEFTDNSNNLLGLLNIVRIGSNHRLELAFFDDSNTLRSTASQNITDEPHDVQLLIKRAETASSIDAFLELWVDHVKIGERRNIDIFDKTRATRLRIGGFSVDAGTLGTFFVDQVVISDTADVIFAPIIQDPAINILTRDAGNTLDRWSALEGASKGSSLITFPKEASGVPARVEYAFDMNRFQLNTAHRFTGFVTPTTLNYPHSDMRWFVKNVTTGQTKYSQLTFDNHSDQGGKVEVGKAKPFNMVFHPKSNSDKFTVGFENFANNQEGYSFTVSNLGVFIVV